MFKNAIQNTSVKVSPEDIFVHSRVDPHDRKPRQKYNHINCIGIAVMMLIDMGCDLILIPFSVEKSYSYHLTKLEIVNIVDNCEK